MKASLALCALVGFSGVSFGRSGCADVDNYFGSMTSTTTEVNLGRATTLACPSDEDTEIVIVAGQHLTIKSDRKDCAVQFTNIRFTVEEGAELVFRVPLTVGPNDQPSSYASAFRVKEGANLTFKAPFKATGIPSVVWNEGSTVFAKESSFSDNVNVVYINTGDLKFRADSEFTSNSYHGIENFASGYVKFSRKATFRGNGGTYDDTAGCGLENNGGTVIFGGDVLFEGHECREASALHNSGGKMRFNANAIFNENVNLDPSGSEYGPIRGAGFRNSGNDGDAIFKGDVQFNRNSGTFGGGLAVSAGKVRFKKAVSFTDNEATDSGGAFVVESGKLNFEAPDSVTGSGNTADSQCSFGYVAGGTVVGFDGDVCDEATVFG